MTRPIVRLWAAVGLACVCTAPTGLAVAADPSSGGADRIALVVGNAGYRDLPLKTPVPDARLVAAALRELDFEVVLIENADWTTMIQALARLTKPAGPGAVRLFYYAGHGMQVRGRNYLHPVGAPRGNEHDLRSTAVDLDELIDHLGRHETGVSVVVVDACRDNLYARPPRRTRGDRAVGLAPSRAARGVVVAFSTSSGGTARDQIDASGHSPYTRRLLEELRVPGVPIERMFKRVHSSVMRDTGDRQQPWLSSSLRGEFCLRHRADGTCGD